MSSTAIRLLSKSRFLAGLQCPLRLWYQCYDPELASPVSPMQQALFESGHEVGRLSTSLYPGGMLIEEDYRQHPEAVRVTLAAMRDPDVPALFEPAFLHDGVRIRVDILERLGETTWNLVEVKSSTSVKDVYLPDVAIQYYVLRGCGLDLAKTGVLHLNNQYLYDGRRLELDELFSFSDLTSQVTALQEGILSRLSLLKQILAGTRPVIHPSRHCSSPYPCEFWEHCTAEKPEFWVMELSGITQKNLDQLGALGIEDTRDIPASFPLTPLQERIRRCVLNTADYIDPALAHELTVVDYPLHFLDFETVGPAIPRYPATGPYQAVPFQWSDHILHEDGTLAHRESLCDEDKDPREEFAETLLEALGERGTIFIYTNYEKRIINKLAEGLPSHRERLLATMDRFKDLQALIKRYYYHPRLHGSFSLKSVLPALVPAMSYQDLAIQEGSLASLAYLRMVDPHTSLAEKAKLREDLLAYCGHDTLGMVKIREELLKRFRKPVTGAG